MNVICEIVIEDSNKQPTLLTFEVAAVIHQTNVDTDKLINCTYG